MVKLSDYLKYLNSEIIKARKLADEESVKIAKEYAEHEYLKYFRVPRFSMPKVNLEIPIKIDELDMETKYDFKIEPDTYVEEVNKEIEKVNKSKGKRIQRVDKSMVKSEDFIKIIKKLEKKDQRFVKNIEKGLNEIDFKKPIKSIRIKNEFTTQAEKEEEDEILSAILKTIMRQSFSPVSARLNNIFVDPDTTKETDKDKILLKLNIEMVEEGLRITKLKDAEGREFEEIIFE